MHIKLMSAIAMVAAANAQQTRPASVRTSDLISAPEAQVTTWIRSEIDDGLPPGDEIAAAAKFRSSITIPIVESKVEEVLASKRPRSCFSNPAVDPEDFVHNAVAFIEDAGDQNALKAASMLMKVDQGRFGPMVRSILLSSYGYGNPFVVAYGGLALHDASLDARIIQWADEELSDITKTLKDWWATALLDRYTVVPNDSQWATDPIASRLNPDLARKLRPEISALAAEALLGRSKR